MTPNPLTLLVALSGTFVACSDGAPVDIGDPLGSNLADYAANWDGYAEAYMFQPTGSDRVRLTLDASGNGTLAFGDSSLPPATDPNIVYPPGYYSGDWVRPNEGFGYPVYETLVEAKRLRLAFSARDLWAGWCALQTPTPRPEAGFYSCDYAGWGGAYGVQGCMAGVTDCCAPAEDSTGVVVDHLVDCGALEICRNICICDSAGCSVPPTMPDAAVRYGRLDAALEANGSQLVGTLTVPDATPTGIRITVRMDRN